ncbi:MAG: class I SAM-dependent DNA methyltransferase [Bacteroidota bacterium]
MSTAPTIVQRLWNYCHVLRDDGVSYGDYVEQLTYLLFLKMADERAASGRRGPAIPEGVRWADLVDLEGEALEDQYRRTLLRLGTEAGLLGVIFRKAQNKIQDPAKLRRLVGLIDQEVWQGLGMDVKGEIYEGLLEKNAADTKSGAGQYFTPRPLIEAIVACVQPRVGEAVCDPAVGTGGFFLAAHDAMKRGVLDRDEQDALAQDTFHGWEIVDNTARLCAMNLFLHGVTGRHTEAGFASPVTVADGLMEHPGTYFDVVLSNPPFGKKSSVTVIGEDGTAQRQTLSYERDDFRATTSNKQLNFLQHIASILKPDGGRAAVVVPDNVLFEGGAGERVRERLLQEYDVHTLLRLPTGIFYAQGVKANVLFFDRRPPREAPWTTDLWVYDLRTNQHFTLKTNPLRAADLDPFVEAYRPDDRGGREESERFRRFTYDEIAARDKLSLDLFWLRDESLDDAADLPEPDVLAADIVESLRGALEQFEAIADALGEPTDA